MTPGTGNRDMRGDCDTPQVTERSLVRLMSDTLHTLRTPPTPLIGPSP